MYYLGSKNEDKFISTAVKIGYPMLKKKMDNITAAAMWRYISNFFGSGNDGTIIFVLSLITRSGSI